MPQPSLESTPRAGIMLRWSVFTFLCWRCSCDGCCPMNALKMGHGLYSASNSFLEGNPIRRMGILANKEAPRSFSGMATIPMQWIALRLE